MGKIKYAREIAQIVFAVSRLFNFDAMQQNKLNDYARKMTYQWIEQRAETSTVEALINNMALIISREIP